ncbi:SAM-dependent methyltransferase [hydrothermal vent metagenome]|uniref:SAM-dependent methyltransferase n=1 Tax=hydrothermal vent metagenome TaxID=652676 RepID=A0A3B0TQS0_9ZZZZ
MGLYNKYILPGVINWACKQEPNMRQREKVVPLAHGNVLEIGVGTGLNLPFYNKEKVKHLTTIDPSEDNWNKNVVDIQSLPFDFEFINAFAESIPMDNNSFDTVVTTYTFCSISDIYKALAEIRRVLKTNGRLLFCEHGKAPDRPIQRWQNMINPIWKHFGGGCNLNRDIPVIIEGNGFKMDKMETMYISGWKPASFNYWGSAEIK